MIDRQLFQRRRQPHLGVPLIRSPTLSKAYRSMLSDLKGIKAKIWRVKKYCPSVICVDRGTDVTWVEVGMFRVRMRKPQHCYYLSLVMHLIFQPFLYDVLFSGGNFLFCLEVRTWHLTVYQVGALKIKSKEVYLQVKYMKCLHLLHRTCLQVRALFSH